MTPPRVEFDLTAEDVIAENVAYVPRDPALRRQRVQQRWVLLAVLFAGGAAAGFFTVAPLPPGVAGGVIGLGLAVGVAAAWPTEGRFRRQVHGTARRLLASPAYRRTPGPRAYELHPGWLRVEAGYLRADLFWDAAVATYRAPDHLLVLFPGPTGAFLPRGAFDTDEAFDRFADETERLISAAGGTIGDPDDED